MSIIGKLTRNLESRYKLYTVLSLIMMVGEVVMETLIPFMMAVIIDTGIMHRAIGYVMRVGFLMVGASCISLACGMFGGRCAAVASQGFSRNLRRNLFAKVQGFSFANADRFSTASLVTRLTTDVTNTQNVYQMIIRMCIRAPLMLVSGIVMSCFINARLAMIFLFSIPLLAVVLSLIASTAYPRYRKMLERYDILNRTVQENLIAIRVVKSFVRGTYEGEKFNEAADAVRDAQVKAERIVIFGMPIMQLVVYVCIIAVLWFGGTMIIGGTLQTGELVSFIAYVTQVLMSLMMLSMIFVMLVISRASVDRIVEIIDEKIDIGNPADEPVPAPLVPDAACKFIPAVPASSAFHIVRDSSIDFVDVSFNYIAKERTCVLSHIDMHIDSGRFVGIIGSTGSSKSTLVQLIPRLYDVCSGRVLVGGIDVRKYDLVSLRNAVAIVLQKNILFSGTIRDNLRWGNPEASDDEIAAACTVADAGEFIASFPKGFETEVEQGGVNLSGGQKQRLCIARALLKKPKILILDDSLSAVDTATDSRIRTALRHTLPDTTKIVITQRITSVQNADCIYVLNNGRVDGYGTHLQLLKENTVYREIYDSQQKGTAGEKESCLL